MRRRWQALCGAVAAAAAIHAGSSWAQTYPGKPVRYVIPFDAGSSPDIVGRTITERLSRLWGQQVVVDNRVGVAGVLGSAYVAKSPPDGYTLLQANIASNAIAELRTCGQSLPIKDSLIAATALVHGFILVTGNTRDFRKAGVKVLDPFA